MLDRGREEKIFLLNASLQQAGNVSCSLKFTFIEDHKGAGDLKHFFLGNLGSASQIRSGHINSLVDQTHDSHIRLPGSVGFDKNIVPGTFQNIDGVGQGK